ncbi:uncharacterized protein PV06_08953 [Exophiala oligosperma]|uniref:CST complex subunit Stn1 N-terminal domain-containing protein n=1 Tax=Exophiala oligosperma TaxID=215243 RepID=A0A0D2AGB2_9EURO|nr:uncharacterized protein PV06_08953 [Exophiala oligosperma]KIW39151.1 hypothetical protein PV06_08953 [Exophiala oligosperma]
MQKPDVKVHHNHNNTDDDDGSPSQQTLTFHPAWSFKASETWSRWVKLTAHEIHHVLKPHEKYAETTTTTITATLTTPHHHHHGHGHGHHRRRDAPLLLFYLNHPIQFVQIVGVVVAFDEYYEKFWLLTIDDSSGSTLDVTCPKPEKEKDKQKQTGGGGGGGRSNATNKNAVDERTTNDDRQRVGEAEEDEEEVLLLHRTLPHLKIGTVVQAKGTLSTFRSCRQLSLLRLNVVADTAREMALVASRTSFLTSTLSKPWDLSPGESQNLRSEAEGERARETERAHRRRRREVRERRREERHARIIAKAYERDEGHRARAADEARIAGEAVLEAL